MPSQDERRSSSAVAAAMTSSPGSRSQIVAGAALADDAELARLRVCAHFRFINTQFPLFRRVTVTQIPVVGPYGLRRLLTTVGVIDASTRYAAYCRLADHFASVEPARAGRNGDQAYVVEAAPYVSGDHVDTNGYSPTMASGSDWTAEENAVLVRAYLDMLRLELSGHPYNKAEMNRRTASQISRSRSSIEYKQRNVSWALFEVSHPFIDGYKPDFRGS